MPAPTPRPARAVAALSLAGVLALSACGSGGTDSGTGAPAVVSDGTTWTVGEVQTATRQANAFLEQNGKPAITPTEASHYLAYADDYTQFGTDVLAKDKDLASQGFTLPSRGIVERALTGDEKPSEATVELVRAYVIGDIAQQAQLPETTELVETMKQRKVTISPRYAGAAAAPNWLEKSDEATTAEAPGEAPADPGHGEPGHEHGPEETPTP